MKKQKLTLPRARKTIKGLQAEIDTLRELRASDLVCFNTKKAEIEKQLADKTNHLLPQQQMILKELSYLVNATSKAVRTTMWALKPPTKHGW